MNDVISETKSKNPNNLQPIYFSDYFKIDKQKLKQLGTFDPIINFDTALFVEPLLLKQSSSKIIRNSTKTYSEYFHKYFWIVIYQIRNAVVHYGYNKEDDLKFSNLSKYSYLMLDLLFDDKK